MFIFKWTGFLMIWRQLPIWPWKQWQWQMKRYRVNETKAWRHEQMEWKRDRSNLSPTVHHLSVTYEWRGENWFASKLFQPSTFYKTITSAEVGRYSAEWVNLFLFKFSSFPFLPLFMSLSTLCPSVLPGSRVQCCHLMELTIRRQAANR